MVRPRRECLVHQELVEAKQRLVRVRLRALAGVCGSCSGGGVSTSSPMSMSPEDGLESFDEEDSCLGEVFIRRRNLPPPPDPNAPEEERAAEERATTGGIAV